MGACVSFCITMEVELLVAESLAVGGLVAGGSAVGVLQWGALEYWWRVTTGQILCW